VVLVFGANLAYFGAVRFGLCIVFITSACSFSDAPLLSASTAPIDGNSCEDPWVHYDAHLLRKLGLTFLITDEGHQHLYRPYDLPQALLNERASKHGLVWTDALEIQSDSQLGTRGTLSENEAVTVSVYNEQSRQVELIPIRQFSDARDEFRGLCFRRRQLLDVDVSRQEEEWERKGRPDEIDEHMQPQLVSHILQWYNSSTSSENDRLAELATRIVSKEPLFISLTFRERVAIISQYFGSSVERRDFPSVYLAKVDPLTGFGLFANEDIAAWQLIDLFDGVEFNLELVPERDFHEENYKPIREPYQSYIHIYRVPLNLPIERQIVAHPIGGYSAFVNHDDQSNVTWFDIFWAGRWRLMLLATQAIKKHDQLFLPYHKEFWARVGKQPCKLPRTRPN